MRKILLTSVLCAALILCSCSPIYDDSSETVPESTAAEESSGTSETADISDGSVDGIFVPAEFTEDDLFVRKFMTETAEKLGTLDWFGVYHGGELFEFDFVQMETPFEERISNPYVLVPEEYPQSAAELKSLAEECLTAESAGKFMNYIAVCAVCERTEGENGLPAVIVRESVCLDENGHLKHYPRILELDGRLYAEEAGGIGSPELNGLWSTAHVISRTDDEIVFAYDYEFYNEPNEMTGRLKYEDGWKCSWWYGWHFDE